MNLFKTKKTGLTLLLTFLSIHFISVLPAQVLLDLKTTLQTVKNSNANLKAQNKNIQLAEADLVTSGLRPNPILNNQSLQLIPSPTTPTNISWENGRNRQIWWQLTKPILLSGVRQNRMDFASSNIRLQEYLYEDTERELLLQVANKWIEAWLACMRTQILRAAVTKTQEVHQQIIGSNENLEAEIQTRQNWLQLRNAESQLKNEIQDLQLFLGSNEKIEIDTGLASVKKSFSDLDSLVAVDLSYRPDLQYYKTSVASSLANIKQQKSNALPTPELGFIFNPQNSIPYVGIYGTLQIPLFARNQGEIKKSQILKLQAEDLLSYQTLKVKNEINKALENYRFNKTNLQDYSEVLTISNLILVRAGSGASEELKKTHAERQIQYFEAEADFLKSVVQLLYVTGRLNTWP